MKQINIKANLEDLASLIIDSIKNNKLDLSGVDNWEHYDSALDDEYREVFDQFSSCETEEDYINFINNYSWGITIE